MDTPPGLNKPRPLRRPKDQQQAAELLTATWDVIPDSIQTKLQALGLGPQPQEEPGLTDLLKTHMSALPQEVQAVVTRLLTAPLPQTEKEIAQQLKQQVTEMKNQSIRKNQLQTKLDQVKSQYAAMLQDMQDIQTKLNEGQQKLKELSDKYMAAVNQTPKPEELNREAATAEPIPMAVESFVTSLGISLTEEQRSQLHGLLKSAPTRREKIQQNAGKPKRLRRHTLDSCVGNNKPNQPGKLQGKYVPIPFDDFDEAHQPWDFMNQRKWVCRAASGSELSSYSDKPWCAGEKTHQEDFAPSFNLGTSYMLHEGDFSCQDEAELPEHKIQPNVSKLVLSSPPSGHDLPVNGQPYVSIKGGAPSSSLSDTATQGQIPMAHDYASTTECIFAESHYDDWKSKCSLLCKCPVASFHLDMCTLARDKHTTMGHLTRSGARIFGHRRAC